MESFRNIYSQASWLGLTSRWKIQLHYMLQALAFLKGESKLEAEQCKGKPALWCDIRVWMKKCINQNIPHAADLHGNEGDQQLQDAHSAAPLWTETKTNIGQAWKISLRKLETETCYVCPNKLMMVLEASVLEIMQLKEALVSVHIEFHSHFSALGQSFGLSLHIGCL